MGEIKYVNPPNMPKPNGPYGYGTIQNGWFYMAGQIPVDPDNPSAALPETIEEQSEIVFKNIVRILDAAGYDFEDVTSVRVYLKDLPRDLLRFNTVYTKYFKEGKYPVRTAVGVTGLAKDALVEVDLVAHKKN
ncbi:MAG: RidA family protein [Sphaerochaetaceae bacterium]